MLELRHDSRFAVVDFGELRKQDSLLLQEAVAVRRNAYAPFSHFTVGAALRADDGTIYKGCNVEDIAYTGTIHAEMTALAAMIAALGPQARCTDVAIALNKDDVEISYPPKRNGEKITTASQLQATPCGHCRTMLAQHTVRNGSLRVVALQFNGEVLITTIHDLYPAGFGF